MSFYADPALASTRLAERAMCKIRLHGTMLVRHWRGRIYCNEPNFGLSGYIIGTYTRKATAEMIAGDILAFLSETEGE